MKPADRHGRGVRWLFWTGGVVALAGLVWFVRIADISGPPGTGPLVGATALFLGGLLVAGLGLRAGVGRE